MDNVCGFCTHWFSVNFEQNCPRMRSQINDISTKLSSLQEKAKKTKLIGKVLSSKGIGYMSEPCNKFSYIRPEETHSWIADDKYRTCNICNVKQVYAPGIGWMWVDPTCEQWCTKFSCIKDKLIKGEYY